MMSGLGPMELICLFAILPIFYWIFTAMGQNNKQNNPVITRVNHDSHNKNIENKTSSANQNKKYSKVSGNDTSDDIKPTTIVQNITYNIQDSAISGDINNEIKNN